MRNVLSGRAYLTCERQVGAQRHVMCGNTSRDRLEILEPVVEDWHCLVCLIGVSNIQNTHAAGINITHDAHAYHY